MGFHVSRMLQRALQLAGRSETVTTVSRFASAAARERFALAGFRVVQDDLSDPDQTQRLPSAENVIFLAGVKFGTSSNAELLQKMNVQMPRLVADRYRDSRIVALSTGCVYSFTTPEQGGASEDDPTDPPGDYARSCIGREQAFTEGSQAYGTRCALVRLNYSIDLTYGVLVDIAKNVLSGQSVGVDTGYVNVIWQGDAVAHTIACLPHASSPPFIVNVAGLEILSVRDIARRFAKLFDCDVSFCGQEASSAWLSDGSLSHRIFGKPIVNVDQMITWIAAWLRQGGETLGKPTHFQNRDGAY
jgi:nucleoside-diphosphate-sugar epimerase